MTAEMFKDFSKNFNKTTVIYFGNSKLKLSLAVKFSNYFVVNYFDLKSVFFNKIMSSNVKNLISEIYKPIFLGFSKFFGGKYE